MKKSTYKTNKQEKGGEQMDKMQRKIVDNKTAVLVVAIVLFLIVLAFCGLIQSKINGINSINVAKKEQLELKETNGIYYISTPEELKAFRDSVNNGKDYSGKTIMLTHSIKLDENEEWEPIGKVTHKASGSDSDSDTTDTGNFFKGTFDGNGYYISGLKINNPEGYSVGLFGRVENATIKNLEIKDSTILGGGKVGAIVGSMKDGTIDNCYTDGSVKVEATMWSSVWGGGLGGILGDGSATIKNCHNAATVHRADVAKNRNEYYSGSSQKNELDYSWNIGGIVGAVSGAIENSYNTGDVGKGEAGLRECYVGGIAGSFNPTSSDKGIEYCYNLGQVGGNHDVGGIAGIVGDEKKDTAIYTPKINHCYDVGKVTIIADAWNNCKQVGAIVGNYQKDEGNTTTDICTANIVTDCYSLYNVACRPEDAGQENANIRNGCDGKTFLLSEANEMANEQGEKITTDAEDITTVDQLMNALGGDTYWKKVDTQTYPELKDQKDTWDQLDKIYISTPEELAGFRNDVNNGNTYEGKTVYLTDNIDLSEYENWTPIGTCVFAPTTESNKNNQNKIEFGSYKETQKTEFKGTFDGQGHTISNLNIDNKNGEAQGLFGFVTGGTIKNLGIKSGTIKGRIVVGAIAGSTKEATIENCYTDSSVNVNAQEISAGTIGGIVGNAVNSTINKCYNKATVCKPVDAKNDDNGYPWSWSYGGIVGRINKGGTVTNCYNSGKIGTNDTKKQECMVGGIVGSIYTTINTTTKIEYCYNLGEIGGFSSVGGLVGTVHEGEGGTPEERKNHKHPQIQNCYNVGNITKCETNNDNYGGILGSYSYNNDSTGQTTLMTSGNISEKAQDMIQNCYTLTKVAKHNYSSDGTVCENIDCDNTTYDKIGGAEHWTGIAGQTTPALACQKRQNITTISSKEELEAFRDDVNNGHQYVGETVTLTENIDLQSEEWEPIVGFSGTFDGQGHTISNLIINKADGETQGLYGYGEAQGLFGQSTGYYAKGQSTIKNLTINNSNITGKGNVGAIVGQLYGATVESCHVKNNVNVSSKNGNAGGLVGQAVEGKITKCLNEGTVKIDGDASANWDFGGIVGESEYWAEIEDCYNTGTIGSGKENHVGGISGNNNSKIQYCYNTGTVNGKSETGGIVGYVYGETVKDCYDIGTVTCNNTYKGAIAGNLRYNYDLSENYCLSGKQCSSDNSEEKDGTTKESSEMCEMDFINCLGESSHWRFISTQNSPALSWQRDYGKPDKPTVTIGGQIVGVDGNSEQNPYYSNSELLDIVSKVAQDKVNEAKSTTLKIEKKSDDNGDWNTVCSDADIKPAEKCETQERDEALYRITTKTKTVLDVESNEETIYFCIDRTVPTITLEPAKQSDEVINGSQEIDGKKCYGKNTQQVQIQYQDDREIEEAKYTCYNKNGAQVEQKNVKINEDTKQCYFDNCTESGKYVVAVTDKAGNTKEETFIIDKEEPIINSVTGISNDWTDNDVTITVIADDGKTDCTAGVKEYSFNGGAEWQTSNIKEFNSYDNNVEIQVKDELGNIAVYNENKPIEIKIDKESPNDPTIEINNEEREETEGIDNQYYYNQDVAIIETSTDTGESGIKENKLTLYKHNGEGEPLDGQDGWEECTHDTGGAKCTLNQKDEGFYKLVAQSTDNAGNKSKEIIVYFCIDTTAPEINGVTDKEKCKEQKNINVTDELSGINTAKYWSSTQKDNFTDEGTNIKENGVYSDDDNTCTLEGNCYYKVTVTDKAGNETTKTFTIDKELPKISGIEENGKWYKENKTVTFSDNLPNCTAKYWESSTETFDGNAQILTSGKEFEAEKYYKIEVTDEVGNTAETTFQIDKTDPEKPKIEIKNETKEENDKNHPYYYNDKSLEITGVCGTDAFSGVKSNCLNEYTCIDESEDGDCVSDTKVQENCKITEEDEGLYRVCMATTDNAGNTSDTTIYICVDQTNPTITLTPTKQNEGVTAGNIENCYGTETQKVTIEYEDDKEIEEAKYTYYNRDGHQTDKSIEIEEAEVCYSEDCTDSGKYVVTVKDKAGNTAEETFIIDKDAPTISNVTGISDEWTNGKVTITVIANDGEEENVVGLAKEAYSFDGGDNWQEGNTKEIDNYTNNIQIRVKDKLGNIAEYDQDIQINIDTENPSEPKIQINGQEKNANSEEEQFYYNKEVTIIETAGQDNGNSGIKENKLTLYKHKDESDMLDGQEEWEQCDIDNNIGKCTINKNEEGFYKLVAQSTDNAENKSNEVIVFFCIDTTAPEINDVDDNGKYQQEKTVNVTDKLSGIETAKYYTSEEKGKFTENGVDIDDNINTCTLSEDKYYKVEVEDKAGNKAEKTFIIDKTAPTISGVDDEVGKWYNQDKQLTFTDNLSSNELCTAKYWESSTDNFEEEKSQPLTSGKNFDGDKYYKVTVKDEVGNETTRTFQIDKTNPEKPTIQIKNETKAENDKENPYYYNDESLTITGVSGKDAFSGVEKTCLAEYDCKNEEKEDRETSKNQVEEQAQEQNQEIDNCTIEETEEGLYRVCATTTDKAGNTSSTTIYVCVDQTDPEITLQQTKAQEVENTVPEDEKEENWYGIDTEKITVQYKDENGIQTAKYTYYDKNGVNNEQIIQDETKSYEKNDCDKSGKYVVTVMDKAGNTATEEFIIDKEAPTISSVTGISDKWTNENVTITVEATDGNEESVVGLAKEAYSFDGGQKWQSDNSKTFNEYTENVQVWVKDKLGNISKYSEGEPIQIKIDTEEPEEPTIEITGLNEEELEENSKEHPYYARGKVTITKTAGNDNGHSEIKDTILKLYKYKQEEAVKIMMLANEEEKWEECGEAVTADEEGLYKVCAKSIDNAGNESKEVTKYFCIDTTAPEINNVNDNGKYNKQQTVNVTDNLSGIKEVKFCTSKDNRFTDEMQDCTEDITAEEGKTFEEDGYYKIKAVDKAGNEKEITFQIDTKAPDAPEIKINNETVTTNTETEAKYYKTEVKVDCTFTEGDLANKEFKIEKRNGDDWTPIVTEEKTTANNIADEGFYRVIAKSTDETENSSEVVTVYFYIDKTAPTAPTIKINETDIIANTKENPYYYKDDVKIEEESGIDELSGVKSNSLDEYKCIGDTENEEGKSGIPEQQKLTITETEDGLYKVCAKTTDNAENESEIVVYFFLDKTPPTNEAPKAIETTNTITVTSNQTDENGSGIAKIEYAIREVKETEEETRQEDWKYVDGQNESYTFENLQQNTKYAVKTRATDNAGNQTESEVTEITTKGIPAGGLVDPNSPNTPVNPDTPITPDVPVKPEETIGRAIEASELTWENGFANITLTTNTEYRIEYQVNDTKEGEWIENTTEEGTKIEGLKHEDVVYARLAKGEKHGEYISIVIKDGKAPSIPEITIINGVIENEIFISNEADLKIIPGTDGETGVDYTMYKINEQPEQKIIENTVIKLTEDGKYKITAYTVDKAGNESVKVTKDIEIKKQGEETYLKSDIYEIIENKDTNMNTISRILPGTNLEEFKKHILTNMEYKVQTETGEEVKENTINEDTQEQEETYIKTGMKLIVKDKEYTLIVTGDINKDGQVSVSDLSMLKKQMIELIKLDQVQEKAADMTYDKEVGIGDLSKMIKFIIGLVRL